jgi:nucleotide-binding universal stress UspA family protein
MPETAGYGTVVVGTDGSRLAEDTVARAARLVRSEHSELVIACAWSGLSRREEAKNVVAVGDPLVGQVSGRAAAGQVLSTAVAVANDLGATVAAALLVDGDAAGALLTVAEQRKADLIVVGARRDASIADRLLGTVASEIVRRAPCDVLIVRPEAGEESELP